MVSPCDLYVYSAMCFRILVRVHAAYTEENNARECQRIRKRRELCRNGIKGDLRIIKTAPEDKASLQARRRSEKVADPADFIKRLTSASPSFLFSFARVYHPHSSLFFLSLLSFVLHVALVTLLVKNKHTHSEQECSTKQTNSALRKFLKLFRDTRTRK